MDTKSKSNMNMVFSNIAIIMGLLSIMYCTAHIVEPIRELEAPTFFAQLSRYIQGGV